MDALREAENTIFHLLQKADRALIAADVEGFYRIQNDIVELQKRTGAMSGIERKEDNGRTA